MLALFSTSGTANPSQSATRFCPADGAISWSTSDGGVAQVLPHALTLDHLHIFVATAPGAGKSLAFTVQKNGADTALTATLSGTATSVKDDSNQVSFAAGDTISIKCVPTSSPTLPGGISITTRQSASGKFAILFDNTTQLSATTFLAIPGANSSGTESAVYAPIPFGCTVQSLYARVDAAPGAGTSWALTVRKNSADTSPALTATIADTNTSAHDTTNQPTFAAGDLIAIRAVVTGAVAAARIFGGFSVVPTTDGDACWLSNRSNTKVNNTTEYTGPHVSSTSYFANETVGASVAEEAITVKGLYAKAHTAPTSGKSWAFTVRKNAADTAAVATIADTNTAGSITGQSVVFAADDLCDISIVPTAAPVTARLMTGLHYVLAAPQNVALNRATETDIANAMGKQKIFKPPQVVETDIANAMVHYKVVHIGQVVETDIAQSFKGRRYVALGQAVETDIARPLAVPVLLPVRTAAGPFIWQWGQQEVPRTILIGQAVENDSAGSFQQNRYQIGQAIEFDTALPWGDFITKFVTLHQAVETDVAGALSKVKAITLHQAFENDTATKLIITGGIPADTGGGLEDRHRRLIRIGVI